MSELVALTSLREFFKALLEQAVSRQKVELAEITEFYLVNLLSEFVSADKLFASADAEGKKDAEPLALLYHRALQQERDERIRTLRRLGDVSLYRAGFFAQSLREGAVGANYYIQMGCAAYGHIADLTPSGGFAPAYRELHQKFPTLVEVLEDISARGMVAGGATGTLRVYESWSRTKDEKLEKVLIDAGLFSPQKGLPN
jgi:hypothetical protein